MFTPDPTTDVATAVGRTGVTDAVGVKVGSGVWVTGGELGLVVTGDDIWFSAVGTRVGKSCEFPHAISKSGSNKKQTFFHGGNILTRLYPYFDSVTCDYGAKLTLKGYYFAHKFSNIDKLLDKSNAIRIKFAINLASVNCKAILVALPGQGK